LGVGDGFAARFAWLERRGRSLMSVNDSSPMLVEVYLPETILKFL